MARPYKTAKIVLTDELKKQVEELFYGPLLQEECAKKLGINVCTLRGIQNRMGLPDRAQYRKAQKRQQRDWRAKRNAVEPIKIHPDRAAYNDQPLPAMSRLSLQIIGATHLIGWKHEI